MKKLLLTLAAACMVSFTFAQDAPLWMRHCAISPDGTTIAFTYKGDIYTVPVGGGRAMQLTTIRPMIRSRYGVLTANVSLSLPTVWEAWMSISFPKRAASLAG